MKRRHATSSPTRNVKRRQIAQADSARRQFAAWAQFVFPAGSVHDRGTIVSWLNPFVARLSGGKFLGSHAYVLYDCRLGRSHDELMCVDKVPAHVLIASAAERILAWWHAFRACSPMRLPEVVERIVVAYLFGVSAHLQQQLAWFSCSDFFRSAYPTAKQNASEAGYPV